MDVVVLTALSIEHDAVYAHLADPREYVDSDGTRYDVGVLRDGGCRVALAVIGESNVTAAALTGRAIEEFAPEALLFVGIAGGLAVDVALGDVVVATRVYAFQGGRAESGGLRARPRGWPIAHGLEQLARGVAAAGTWTGTGDTVRVHFKPLVSGDVVLDARTGPVAELIDRNYGDAIAIDMESVGVAEAAHRKDFYRAVTVRGVSDAAGGDKRRTDAAGWQRRAAAHAAAFAVALAERIVQPAGPRPGRPSDLGPCPYRGLAAFREPDADLFFGRDQVADELAGRVARHRFVALVGPSGSGKSSLLHAGLLPRLRRDGWAIAAFRPLPGVPAAKILAAGLLALLPPERRAALPPAATTAELVGEVLVETGTSRVLVCVDQFEELDRPAAQDLAGMLAQLATGALPVHVVLTMRTETLDLAAGQLGLGELARNAVFLLTPMLPAELRVAVEAPAGSIGVTFEPGLVDRIVAAAGGSPAALPLTQFALTRLWEEQEGTVLTHAVYAGFDGVEGALAGYAERVWSTDLDDAERALARRLFVQLIRPTSGGGAVRRTARARELDPDLLPVARRLAATRLVVAGAEPAAPGRNRDTLAAAADAGGELGYDLAHAALATHWQRLRNWLAEERDFRAWQEDLRESMRRDEPLRGPRLAGAQRWLRTHPDGVTGAERAFVDASRRRQRRRTVAWRGAAALVTVLAVLASTLAVVLGERSAELAAQLRRSAAYELINEASERAPSQPDTAALMTVAAYRASSDPAILAHLAGEYLRYRSTTRLLPSNLPSRRQVRMSADGRVVAAVGIGGGVVWRLDEQPVTPQHLSGLTTIALSPDGRSVAGIDESGQVLVWRPDGTKVALGRSGTTAALRFDAAGKRLLATPPGAEPKVWDVEGRTPIRVPEGAIRQVGTDVEARVWFGPEGRSLVVAGDGRLSLWSLSGREDRLGPLGTTHAAVTRNGRTAFTCTDGTLFTWDLAAGKDRSRRVLAPDVACPNLFDIRLDPSGSAILAGDRADHTGDILLTGAPREGGDQHVRFRMSLVDLKRNVAAYPVLPPNAGISLAYDIATTGDQVRMASSAGSNVAVVDLPRSTFTPIDPARLEPDFGLGPLLGPEHRWAAIAPDQPPYHLSLLDTVTGKKVTKESANWLVRFTADGRRLLTLAAADKLAVRNVPSLDIAHELRLPTAPGVRPTGPFGPYGGICVDDTADPDTVAVVFAGLVSRFDLRSGKQIDEVRLGPDTAALKRLERTATCAVRPGRNEIAFNTDSGVEVWSMAEKRRVVDLLPLKRPTGIADIEFSTDGRLLAVLGADGTLDVWDVDRGLPAIPPLAVLPAGLPYVSIVDFRTADRIVVRIGGGLRIWDLHRGSAIANVDIDSLGSQPSVSPDGSTLLLWMRSASLLEIPIEPARWADHLCEMVGRDLTDDERRTLPAGSPDTNICPS